MTRRFIILSIGLLFLVDPIAALRGQTPTFPDSLESETLRLSTDRFSSTHNAALGLDYTLFGSGIQGLVRAHLSSSSTLRGVPLTRETVDLLVDMRYDLNSSINPFILFEGTTTGEVGEIGLIPGIDNTAATFLGVGARAEDAVGNGLGLAIGGAYNRQLNTEDAGAAIYADGIGSFDLDGTRIAGDGTLRWYNTNPRLNGSIDLFASLERSFEEGVFVAARASYNAFANDLYVKRREEDIRLFGGPTFDALLQRREQRFDVGGQLFYPVSTSVSLLGELNVAGESTLRSETDEGLPPLPRSVDPFSFDRRQSDVGGSMMAILARSHIDANIRLSLRSGSQSNVVDPTDDVPDVELRRRRATSARNDYATETRSIDGYVQWRAGRSDTFAFSGALGLYRYDTPDTANNFDKDEQTFASELQWGHRFSRRTSISVETQIFLAHLVYLFGESSGDNNWNRVFRLAPSVNYTLPDRITNRLTTEIVANYTDYDFESRDGEVRGRSFRELRIRDSLVVLLPKRLGIGIEAEMRIAERGSFVWELFAESLLDRSRTEQAAVEIFRGRDSSGIVAFGGKLARFRSFQVDPRGGLLPTTERVSVGPTARLTADVGRSTRLEASGWYEFQFVDGNADEQVPWLFVALVLSL